MRGAARRRNRKAPRQGERLHTNNSNSRPMTFEELRNATVALGDIRRQIQQLWCPAEDLGGEQGMNGGSVFDVPTNLKTARAAAYHALEGLEQVESILE